MSMSKSGAHKIVVLGAGAVGKSSITIRMVVNEFQSDYNATIEDSYTTEIKVDGKNAVIDILDTAGQEQFKALRNVWIREGEAFLLVYAVNSQTSFKVADNLYQTILRYKDGQRIDLVLVGNKCDLAESQHDVTYNMGKQLADTWKVPFIQTSAKTGNNVSEAFDMIVREIRKEKMENKDMGKKEKKIKSNKCSCIIL